MRCSEVRSSRVARLAALFDVPAVPAGRPVPGSRYASRRVLGTFGGLQVILDANVGTTYGAGTNEDEIYVLNDDDLLLFEGPVRGATYEDVGSGTLTVRQLFAYSFFVPNRQVKRLCILSGSGLAAPTFP